MSSERGGKHAADTPTPGWPEQTGQHDLDGLKGQADHVEGRQWRDLHEPPAPPVLADRLEHVGQPGQLERSGRPEQPSQVTPSEPSVERRAASEPSADNRPARRSISERLASLDAAATRSAGAGGVSGGEDPALAGSPLTETTTHALGLTNTAAFRVHSTGQVDAGQPVASIAQNLQVGAPQRPLSRENAETHHLLVVGEDVTSDELEALAISIWDEAGWLAPGTLRLGAGGTLSGPWPVDDQVRRVIRTPADMQAAWVLECDRTRGQAPSASLQAHDRWAHAFPDGMPAGVELKTLLALERMARRLAGAIRVAGSGDVIRPDPDSAVDLRVFSPRWVGPDDLADALRPEFPDVLDSRDVPVRVARRSMPAEMQRVAAVSSAQPPLSPRIQDAIDADRAAVGRQVVDGYALVADVGNRSGMMVEVHAVPRPPRVLRWESWPSGVIVEYALRWMPQGSVDMPRQGLTRTARLERLRSATDIEKAAGIVVQVTGGLVVDEDGFLVGIDQDQ